MGRGNAYLVMWKHVCDNANVRIWWIGYIYMVMWNVHAAKWRHRFENEKNMDSVIRMPDLVMRICAIGNVRIRARWIGPLRLTECFATNFMVDVGNWRGVSQPISWWTWGIGGVFATNFVVDVGNWRSVSLPISWVLRKHSPNVRHVFAICLTYIHKMFATCWLSVCYILTEQKGGFCIAKVWFLACKKGVFDGQK